MTGPPEIVYVEVPVAYNNTEVVYVDREPEIVYVDVPFEVEKIVTVTVESEPEIIYIESEPEIIYVEKEEGDFTAYFDTIFKEEFTIYGLPEQFNIGEIQVNAKAFKWFAAITNDQETYINNGKIGFWFFDMEENFCYMLAETKGAKVTGFIITDPYNLCGHTWPYAKAFNDENDQLIGFNGPKGQKYLIYSEEDVAQDPDFTGIDWYDQIKFDSSWYLIPSTLELIDIARD